jgi:dTDP-4-dehydrorhamnose reductase
MASRVLITGGSGLLGLNWANELRHSHQVTLGVHSRAVSMPGVAIERVSLESVDNLLSALDRVRPDCVVHAAGLTSVEDCEANPCLAHHVNVELAENVATACARRGVKLAHMSTDHVFGGSGQLFTEDACIKPINTYGKTKAEAEARVQYACPEALVIRTNFYGWGPAHRQSFSDWIIKNLVSGQQLTLFRDVFYSPIIISRLVSVVHQLFECSASGLFHVVGDDRISKHDFGLQLASVFGLDASLISAGSINAQPSLVIRPHDMSLSNRKVSETLNIRIGGVHEHLLMLQQQSKLLEELQTYDSIR